MQKNFFLKASGLILLFALALVLTFNCAKKSSPTDGSGATLTIVTNLSAPDSLLVGGTCVVSATVTTAGRNDSGEVVTFSASSGSFSKSVDTSNVDGMVSTIFTGTTAGTAYIYARTSDTTASVAVHIYSSTTPGEGGLTIQVNPSILPANGDTTSRVTVTVRDLNGSPIESSVVRLAAGEKFRDVDGDGYYNKNIDQLVYDTNKDGIWNPIGNIPSTATTNDSGIARTTYTAGLRAGMVYIKATAGSPDDPITDDAVILLIPTIGDTVASIALAPSSPTIQVKGTGGIEFVQMSATCYDDNGNRVIEGWPVIFTILNGPNGGENINGSASPCTVLTNSSGIAQVTVNSGTISGTINLIARSGSVTSNSTRITVCAGPPAFIAVGAEPCNIHGLHVVNETSDIVAVVVDSFGNYVPNGTSVYFTVNEGMITPNSETVEGIATATYHSTPPYTDSGRVAITAETAGGTVVGMDYLVVSGDPVYIFFEGVPYSLPASPKFDVSIYTGVADEYLNPVVGGFEIELEALYGNIAGGTTGNEDICAFLAANAIKSKYTSTSLEKDYMWSTPDNGLGARESLTAASGFARADTFFYLTTEYSSKKNSSIISESQIDYGSFANFSVEIKDTYGNPLGGHRINVVSISNGDIDDSVRVTNAYGIGNFYFSSANYDTTLKSVTIVVADTADPRGGILLSKKITLGQP